VPNNIQIAAFVLGAILVLLAIVGGNLEIFGAKIGKEDISTRMRVVSGFLGILFVLVGLLNPSARFSFRDPSPPEATVTSAPSTITVVAPQVTGTDTSAPKSSPQLNPTDAATTIVSHPSPQSATTNQWC
jgi:hypothetical protein